MEVHHHKHAAGHSRSWKSGFSEFFMLFLAVFFAFIAENLREHYVEKSREKQYIQSMINDLKRDTLQLGLVSKATKKVFKGIDTLLYYLKADTNNDTVAAKLYRYAAYSTASILYQHSTATMSQLKNAGGFRLLHDTASVNGIAFYDQGNEMISKQGDAYYKETIDIIDMFGEIMDFSVAKPPLIGNASKTKPVFFIRKDPDRLRAIYNKCFMQQRIIYGYTRQLDSQKKEADSLISLLNKNYHLTTSQAKDTLHTTKKT